MSNGSDGKCDELKLSRVKMLAPDAKVESSRSYSPVLEKVVLAHPAEEDLGIKVTPAGAFWDARALEARAQGGEEHPADACVREGGTWSVKMIIDVTAGPVMRYNEENPDAAAVPGTLLVWQSPTEGGTVFWIARWSWHAVVKLTGIPGLGAFFKRDGPFATVITILDMDSSLLERWNMVQPQRAIREGDYLCAANGQFFASLGPKDQGALTKVPFPEELDMVVIRAPKKPRGINDPPSSGSGGSGTRCGTDVSSGCVTSDEGAEKLNGVVLDGALRPEEKLNGVVVDGTDPDDPDTCEI